MTPLYTFERAELERAEKLNKKLANASRQRAYKDRMAAEGFVQVHGWVHNHQLADVVVLLHKLQSSPELMVGPARHELTGKLVKLR